MEQNSDRNQPILSWFDDEDAALAPSLLKELESLVEHPGWLVISNILERQAAIRTNSLVTSPLKGLDAALEQEYMKGEAAQLLTLRGLPTVLIDELREVVKRMREDADRTDA